MKFTSQLAVAVLATGAVANIVDRQIATVTGVLSDVQDGIDSLDSAVKAFSGDADPVVSSSEKLVSTINDGESTVSGSSDLTLKDALGLQAPVTDLTTHAQTLADDLKAQRSAIEKGGFCSVTRKQISAINSASQALIKATVGKVPSDAQSIAQTLAQGVTDVLNQAQDDFSESNCVDATDGGSGGSSSTGGAQTSAGQTSAAQTSAAPTNTEGGSPTTGMTMPTGTGGAGTPPATTSMASPPQGGNGTTGTPPPVTAGAANLAPAGALLVAAVAALL